jgi:hypothetical protein
LIFFFYFIGKQTKINRVYLNHHDYSNLLEKDFLFLLTGRICSALLDQSKSWNQFSLAEVVEIVINLIDQPDRGHVVDAGEYSDIFSLLSFNRFLTY